MCVEEADDGTLCLIWVCFKIICELHIFLKINSYLLRTHLWYGILLWVTTFDFMFCSQIIRMWRNRLQQGALSHRWASVYPLIRPLSFILSELIAEIVVSARFTYLQCGCISILKSLLCESRDIKKLLRLWQHAVALSPLSQSSSCLELCLNLYSEVSYMIYAKKSIISMMDCTHVSFLHHPHNYLGLECWYPVYFFHFCKF